MNRILLYTTFICFSTIEVLGQVLSTDPAFPQENDNLTITYDASLGNAALKGFTGTVYAHTGVITDKSTSGTDWKYVKGTWGTANAPKCTSLGSDKYSININTVRSFYNVPSNEKILKIAILFRSEDGNTVGRASDGSDLYVDIFEAGLFASINSPGSNAIYNVNDPVSIEGESSLDADLTLKLNGATVKTAASTKSISHSSTATSPGNYTLELIANNGSSESRDTSTIVVNPATIVSAVPSGLKNGINYTSATTATLVLYAPYKKFVYVIGDFNDWSADINYFMKRDPNNSTYWLELTGLQPGEKYAFQYFVDGTIKVADPHSEIVLDPNNDPWIPNATYPNPHPYPQGKTSGIATLMEMAKTPYTWQVPSFNAPAEDELVVYELLVRDFIEKHDYLTLIDTLDYLTNLGVNAIELMPVNEFEGNESWGYNPSFHMALDKYYGTPTHFKMFIDECHKRGIAVILDAVFNHAFSQSPLCQLWWDAAAFKPDGLNPYLNRDAKHDFNVGYDFNHSSQAFKDFMKQCLEYWLTEYKVDGFRFDLSKGFTQKNTLGDIGAWGAYDIDRVNNIKRIYNECKNVNPNTYVILEHFADNSEEKDLANFGCMFWGNSTHEAQEAAMGYSSNFNAGHHGSRDWNSPKLLAYAESHDEERITFKSLNYGNGDGTYRTKDIDVTLDRMELVWVLFGSIPGPKMIWQFGELGYDYSIDYNGRVGNKPIKWDYNQASNRRDVYEVYGAINKLKTDYPAFTSNTYRLDLGGMGKRIHLDHQDMNVVVLGNFDVKPIEMVADFQSTGWWYDYFSGDSINVTQQNMNLSFEPGEYQLWTDKNLKPSLKIGSINTINKTLRAYPNPVTYKLYLELTQGEINLVQIFDAAGREVLNTLANPAVNTREIDVSILAKGSYIVLATGEGKSYVIKFIK